MGFHKPLLIRDPGYLLVKSFRGYRGGGGLVGWRLPSSLKADWCLCLRTFDLCIFWLACHVRALSFFFGWIFGSRGDVFFTNKKKTWIFDILWILPSVFNDSSSKRVDSNQQNIMGICVVFFALFLYVCFYLFPWEISLSQWLWMLHSYIFNSKKKFKPSWLSTEVFSHLD